jgi:hypothetical protein
MTNHKFKEKSRYGDRVIIGAICLSMLALLFLGAENALSANFDWRYQGVCLTTMAFLGGILYFLNRTRMKVSINEDRIKFKVRPFHQKSRRIGWEDVEDCQIIRTNEQEQWQGGNIHRPGEIFISLVGRNGLSIRTKSGRQYFIGCKDVDGLTEALAG